MLTRVAETVTAVNSRPHRSQEQVHQFYDLVRASEQFLTTMAQQNVGLDGIELYLFQLESETRIIKSG